MTEARPGGLAQKLQRSLRREESGHNMWEVLVSWMVRQTSGVLGIGGGGQDVNTNVWLGFLGFLNESNIEIDSLLLTEEPLVFCKVRGTGSTALFRNSSSWTCACRAPVPKHGLVNTTGL